MPKYFMDEQNIKWAVLNANDAAARRAGKLVGRYITHSLADGHAVYEITSVTATSATFKAVDIGDAWVLPEWGIKTRLSISTVNALLFNRDFVDNKIAERNKWWDIQAVGSTLHYQKGSGQFIRGVVIDEDGEKMLKPTAMVGNGWSVYDLWTRHPTGEVSYGYHIDEIRNAKSCKPGQSLFFESPQFSGCNKDDPREMVALQISPPAMTVDEEALADVANLHWLIKKALATVEYDVLRFTPGGDIGNLRQKYLDVVATVRDMIASRADMFINDEKTPIPR